MLLSNMFTDVSRYMSEHMSKCL